MGMSGDERLDSGGEIRRLDWGGGKKRNGQPVTEPWESLMNVGETGRRWFESDAFSQLTSRKASA